MAVLVGLVAVKNEEDIIELFIRHNLNYLDELHIIENGSQDNTALIIDKLKSEGLNIRVNVSRHSAQDHSRVLNLYSKLLNHADYIFFLDADEFINADSKDHLLTELSAIPSHQVGRLDWQTYVPTEKTASKNYLKEITHRKLQEDFKYGKVVVPKALIGQIDVVLGNHAAIRDNQEVEMYSLKSTLAHFPIRSEEQIISKVILGSHVFSMSSALKADQGFHWKEMAQLVRDHNYELNSALLTEMALNYERKASCLTLIESPLNQLSNVEIKYSELQRTNMLKKFDVFISQIIEQAKTAGAI